MTPDLSLQHFRFRLEPKGSLQMPACLRASHRQAYNKGSARRLTPKGNGMRGLALLV
jgi:hypothetical protein